MPLASGTGLLPVEIWAIVFEQFIEFNPARLYTLPNKTLMQICLTCRTFHVIALPLLFRTFSFHTFVVPKDRRSYRCMLPSLYLEWQTEKFEFYTSDRIAKYVRVLWVSPIPEKLQEGQIMTQATPAPPDYHTKLEHQFFEAVPKFINVRSMTALSVEFDGFALNKLARLPTLQTLHLISCKTEASEGISLSLKKFIFCANLSGNPHCPDIELKFAHDWLSMLCKAKLERLELPLYPRNFLRPHSRLIGPFPSLLKLDLNITTISLSGLHSILSHCSCLRWLGLSLPPSNVVAAEDMSILSEQCQSLPPLNLPHLLTYKGPSELLHAILNHPLDASMQAPLRHLMLDPIIQDAEHISSTWSQLVSPKISAQLRLLEGIVVKFCYIENEQASKLLEGLPKVQNFMLLATDRRSKVTSETFLDVVCVSCSHCSALRFLSIEWTAAAHIDVKAKHKNAKEKLVAQIPSLCALWLCDWTQSALMWKRTSLGEEITVEHESMLNYPAAGNPETNVAACRFRNSIFSLDALDLVRSHKVLDSSPDTSLQAVSLTCRAFHDIAVPLSCRTTPPSPLCIGRLPSHYVQDQTEKLAFYASDRIAGCVHIINLDPMPLGLRCPEETTIELLDPQDLPQATKPFFDIVHKFRNARMMLANHIDFDAFALESCRSMNVACLVNCSCISINPWRSDLLSEDVATKVVHRWLDALCKDKLGGFELPLSTPVSLFDSLSSIGPFPLLSKLEIGLTTGMLPGLYDILSNSDNLRWLRLSLPSDWTAHEEIMMALSEQCKSFPVIELPFLITYIGPSELLHAFILHDPQDDPSEPDLRRLQLDPIVPTGNFSHLSAPHFSSQLCLLSELNITFCYIENDQFSQLLKLIPNIEVLVFEAVDRDLKVTDHCCFRFRPLLTPSLSCLQKFLDEVNASCTSASKMRFLAVDWTAGSQIDVEAKHRRTKEILVAQLPSLEKLWICDWTRSALMWKCTSSGEEALVEYETGDPLKNEAVCRFRDSVFST
ncbi:LOW QUALITY PROTEIN: hypothetical protein CVT26_002821 [Gymnopilus dilepis]|uniref:F-box domain-containing protein n=1 Tax=Gymnopilus dilepis TaxID=231916 RepID=A0A409Y3B9_9AGAR|nr:LOW QUALITY PROTEIN: hypothetical protein CVT26_002821 [Gymnopilus dilepis]